MLTVLMRLIAARGRMRFRLLPAVIFCAAFTLTLKLGAIWHGLDPIVAPTSAVAQDQPAGPANKPATDAAAPARPDAVAAAKDGKRVAGNPKDAKGDRAGTAKAWFDPALVTDSELEVLQKLAERRSELEQRNRELETRERLLQATEKRIDGKLLELKAIQTTINGLLAKHDKQKEEQLKSVVKIYENMKPKDAARIFDGLDMAVLLDVIERMRETKTAPVLAGMTPAKAKAVTAALAQRRMLPEAKPQEQQ